MKDNVARLQAQNAAATEQIDSTDNEIARLGHLVRCMKAALAQEKGASLADTSEHLNNVKRLEKTTRTQRSKSSRNRTSSTCR